MDETIFSQKGLENILNPSKKKNIAIPDDSDVKSDGLLDNSQFTNYFQNWPQNNAYKNQGEGISLQNSDLKKNIPVIGANELPSAENAHDTQTNSESFPQVMEHMESLGRVPAQQVITFVIQMLNSLLGQSEFQDQLIQELLRRKDFCEKMRNILVKDILNQSLKY